MSVTSVALFPGDEIPLPPHGRRTWAGPNPGSIGLWLSWITSVVAGLGVASAAYVTYATSDYRPILIAGVWQSVVALLALHGASLLARGWKARIPVAIVALLILSVLRVILSRLSAWRRRMAEQRLGVAQLVVRLPIDRQLEREALG